ncbi:RNA helicase [Coprinopsis cinerea AmutBmut pab1-1]|nr:RNA helicase [Coprinopsis cinerea AmutBmut pab1-1]
MASQIWNQVARACLAASRPRTALLVPTLRQSFLLARIPSRYGLVQPIQRGFAVEATSRVLRPESVTPASAVKVDEDISDDKPLFSSLQGKVHDKTLKALTQSPFQYNHMSVVQAEVLPLLPGLAQPRAENPESKDLLVKARTGTGKTIAFLVPALEARVKQLEDVAPGDRRVQHRYAMDNVGALVISPTRELATQIVQEAQKLTTHHPGYQVPMFVGGLDKRRQLEAFQRGRKDILVATPGRLMDMLTDSRSGVAQTLKNTKMLILDEADTLLDMGFRDDIEAIMRYLPDTTIRQTLLFSATVSPQIQQIAQRHLSENQLFINCVSDDTSPVHAHIPQYHTIIPSPKDQIPHVLRLIFQDQLEHGDKSKIIIFLPTTKMTQLLSTILYELSTASFPMTRTYTYEIHSKKSMSGRTSASNGFRKSNRASILVTSDVSARGVDYPGVTRVIQLGLPSKPEQYVHRVGRTGRGGSNIGRGDLVIAAWEHEFVKRNLSHIPLKPLTVKDLREEVESSLQPKVEGGKPHHGLIRYQDLERNTSEVLARLDEGAVSETMMSLLGFYVSMISQLRASPEQVLKEMQDWTTQGLGLTKAPYVSAGFLQKIGLGGAARSSRGAGFNQRRPSQTFGARREWRDNDGESSRRSSGRGYMRDPENSDRKPWESRRPSTNKPWIDRRPASDGDRSNDDFEASRPRYSTGRYERGEGYQSRRSRSWESRGSRGSKDDFDF